MGQATEQVNLALGLPLNLNLTALNPVMATLNGAATALVADAVLTNVVALAQAGDHGRSVRGAGGGDLRGQTEHNRPHVHDHGPGAGLSVSAAAGVSVLAKAGATLLT